MARKADAPPGVWADTSNQMALEFRRAGLADLPLLNRWIVRPHVAEWWDSTDEYDESDLADAQSELWIVLLFGRPFAFAQDYAVHGFGPHHFDYLPAGARGIDQFIGEPDLIGQGHGTALVHQQVARLFRAGAPVIATDPHPANLRAIRAYERAGFRASGAPRNTAWGLVQPMECWPLATHANTDGSSGPVT